MFYKIFQNIWLGDMQKNWSDNGDCSITLKKQAIKRITTVMEDIVESINGTIGRGIIFSNLLLIIQLDVINIPVITYRMTSADAHLDSRNIYYAYDKGAVNTFQ